MDMNLDHIRSFLEVYRLGSMTEAARNLHMTQPAVSMHIKSLEASLGRPLFLRLGRSLQATPVADELARTISQPLDVIESTITQIKSRSTSVEGTVHIVGPGEFTQYAAAHVMATLLSMNIRLRLQTGGRQFVVEQLEAGQADLAIMASAYQAPSMVSDRIAEETLIPVASPDWAARYWAESDGIEQLLDKPVIAYDEHLPLIDRYFQETIGRRCQQTAIATVPDLRIILRFLIEGQGYSVLPDYMCFEPIAKQQLVQLACSHRPPVNHLYLVTPKINLRHPRIACVREYLLNHFPGSPLSEPRSD